MQWVGSGAIVKKATGDTLNDKVSVVKVVTEEVEAIVDYVLIVRLGVFAN